MVLYSNYFHLPVVRLVEKLGFQIVQVSGGDCDALGGDISEWLGTASAVSGGMSSW